MKAVIYKFLKVQQAFVSTVFHLDVCEFFQLYDLYTGRYSKGENHVNGCPDEDLVCGVNSPEGPRCGKNGICELTDALNKQYKCTCKPGYRPAGPDKENCEIGKYFYYIFILQESDFHHRC